MDSWFREIHVPQAWCVCLVTGFNFLEKIVLVLSQPEPRHSRPSLTLPLDYEGRVKGTIFPKTHVRIKYNNS